MSGIKVLIVEDEMIVAADLAARLKNLGFDVLGTAQRAEKAIEMADGLEPQLILMDISLQDGMNGIEAARVIRSRNDIPVVFLTAHSDPATLEKAKSTGPFGYILKPFEERDLTTQIEMALYKHRNDKALKEANDMLEERVRERTRELEVALDQIKALKERLENENIYLREENRQRHGLGNIVGESDGLKYVLFRAKQVAPVDTNVLILGETGTGKELIAAAIHELSSRRKRPMITVNCAALPASLIESELFGREKGAFTGADARQVGRFEIADGSTLCLDEIGEMPLELQAKLLRTVQYGTFERLGSSKTMKVDVRLIATTNRNLEEEVKKGRFRQDLYYRLNVFPITVPPLRQRRDDIPSLVGEFIERYSVKMRRKISSVSGETMKMLQDYSWPGNVRELESVIERAVIVSPGPVLQLADKLDVSSPPPDGSSARTLEETERRQIQRILSETGGRIEGPGGAAEILGLNASTLRARMKKLGVERLKIK